MLEKLGLEREPNSILREKPKKKYGKKRKRYKIKIRRRRENRNWETRVGSNSTFLRQQKGKMDFVNYLEKKVEKRQDRKNSTTQTKS